MELHPPQHFLQVNSAENHACGYMHVQSHPHRCVMSVHYVSVLERIPSHDVGKTHIARKDGCDGPARRRSSVGAQHGPRQRRANGRRCEHQYGNVRLQHRAAIASKDIQMLNAGRSQVGCLAGCGAVVLGEYGASEPERARDRHNFCSVTLSVMPRSHSKVSFAMRIPRTDFTLNG